MLAIISDLHLQHTSQDGVRYRDGDGKVRHLTIDRNVSVRALQRFCKMLDERARRCGANRVELILAGDIFEIHRSPRWFETEEGRLRPYAVPEEDAPEKTPLQGKTEQILEDIRADNEAFLRELEEFVRHGRYHFTSDPGDADAAASEAEPERLVNREGKRIPVWAHYIPGNHDRLVNGWESTRQTVREWVGMRKGKMAFDHVLDSTLDHDPDSYGTRVRHGHEYHAVNFAGPVKDGASLSAGQSTYLRPCLGDYATTDVATRLALAFRVHNAVTLREAGERGGRCRAMYAKLTEFDDVRPVSELGDYLLVEAQGAGEEEAGWLLPALRDVCAAARASEFVGREVARLRLAWGLADEAVSVVDPILGATPAWGLYPLIRAVTWLVSRTKDGDRPVEFAVKEPGLGKSFGLVVAGHTHYPTVVPMEAVGPRHDGFFADTGTWRTLVPHGAGRFGHLRAYTMVFVYSERESRPSGIGDRRFETWTGHLAPRGLTCRQEAEERCAEPRKQEVVFTELEVKSIPEDGVWFAKGAELKLHFGVDGQACPAWRQKVRSGKSYSIEDSRVELDQELDGELWSHAAEADVALDDVLPWSLARLPREEDGNFVEGPGTLTMCDETTHMKLRYEVRGSE